MAPTRSAPSPTIRPAKPIEVAECCPSVIADVLDDDEAAALAQAFAALSDPVRLRLLNLVATTPEVCSCDLTGPLGRSQPTVSHHTKVLSEAGLLVGEKRGRWVYWRAVPERLAQLRTALGPASPP